MQNKIENETQITVFDNFADGNIEVLFQDEVKLDVEVSLFYIKSGQEEIQYYVDNTSIPQIESFTVTKIEDIKENINSYVEETTKPEISEYVETEIIPSLDEYKTQTAADAQSASASALASEQSATNAAGRSRPPADMPGKGCSARTVCGATFQIKTGRGTASTSVSPAMTSC